MYLSNGQIRFQEFDLKSLNKIPVGNWLVMYDEQREEYYLKSKPDFNVPEKIYGDCDEVSDKFLNTFRKSEGNLGVLLSGTKGTGKSLTSRMMCIKSELPVLIIPEQYAGADFTDFFSKIDQEAIIFVDEFEKIYSNKDDLASQEAILSLLDGSFSSRFLFLFTINELNKMNEHLIGRPGRIFYHKKYGGLSKDMIDEVLNDMLENKSKKRINDIMSVCNYLGVVSMDSLVSIIQECNMYPDEDPKELIKTMNLVPDSQEFDLKIFEGRKLIYDSYYSGSPINKTRFKKHFWTDKKKDEDGDKGVYVDLDFRMSDADVQVVNDCIKVTHDKYRIEFTKVDVKKFVL